jgi:hypothetical protein
MTDKKTPPDWVLIEAAKRTDRAYCSVKMLRAWYADDEVYRALCDMIERYEQPPVDRKVLCAREALSEANKAHADVAWSDEDVCVRAIELYEGGFGK